MKESVQNSLMPAATNAEDNQNAETAYSTIKKWFESSDNSSSSHQSSFKNELRQHRYFGHCEGGMLSPLNSTINYAEWIRGRMYQQLLGRKPSIFDNLIRQPTWTRLSTFQLFLDGWRSPTLRIHKKHFINTMSELRMVSTRNIIRQSVETK